MERLNANTAIVQENHYGAWGDVLEGIGTSGDWKFLYQGNEYVDAFGYNMSDFHSRQFDAYSGRFTQIDGADQFASGYTGMGNMPTVGIDPDGQIVWFVWAGAAVIGGVGNLASNWSKVKNFKQGLAYFGSGAVGGLIAVTNPWAGGATTAGANAIIDVTTGNLPKFENGWDYAKYAGGLALDGLGAAGAGTLAKTGLPKLASYFSSNASVSMGGRSGATIVNYLDEGFETVANYEVIVKPAIKGFGQNTLAQGIKQGLNFADDAGQGFSSFNKYKSVYGKAGEGQAWHHIVEKHADNIGQFGAESIHNTKNLIKLPEGAGSIHRKVTGFYNSLMPETGMRVRDYVKTLDYNGQYQFGIETLKKFGWTPR